MWPHDGVMATWVETERFDLLRDAAEVTVYARRGTSPMLTAALAAMACPM